MTTLQAFEAAIDRAIWLNFNGFQRRLEVAGTLRTSIALEAWSGGGQTSPKYVALREKRAKLKGNIAVPTEAFPFRPSHKASDRKILVDKPAEKGAKMVSVSASRGHVLPPGDWIAVHKSATEFRQPTAALGQDKFPTWWLKPIGLNATRTDRDMDTFYIHVTGYLGSDGCIVMEVPSLQRLDAALADRPYAYLRCAVFEGPKIDGLFDASAVA